MFPIFLPKHNSMATMCSSFPSVTFPTGIVSLSLAKLLGVKGPFRRHTISTSLGAAFSALLHLWHRHLSLGFGGNQLSVKPQRQGEADCLSRKVPADSKEDCLSSRKIMQDLDPAASLPKKLPLIQPTWWDVFNSYKETLGRVSGWGKAPLWLWLPGIWENVTRS